MNKLMKKYYIEIIIGAIVLVIVLGLLMKDDETSVITFNPSPSDSEVEEIKYIYVDIKGEVRNPGVYKVEETTRLFQLIILAGGITSEADEMAYNSSIKLKDEQVIYIPSITEQKASIVDKIEEENEGIININTATLEQLDTLPGIGVVTAQNIIDYREENGNFQTIDDLINVPGIGEATMNEIKDFITT